MIYMCLDCFFKLSKKSINTLLFILVISIPSVYAGCTYHQTIQIESFVMGNMLTWSTSSEENNKVFVIEKSDNGIHFQSIGQVKGAGTATSLNKYRFLDVSASKGANFYRLKQVDKNNTHQYSAIVSIKKKTGNNFTIISMITPDKDNSIFELTVNAVTAEIMDFTIYDMNGSPIYTQKQLLQKGINVISVDMETIGMQVMGFANAKKLGKDIPYKVALKGKQETETLTIGYANQHKKIGN